MSNFLWTKAVLQTFPDDFINLIWKASTLKITLFPYSAGKFQYAFKIENIILLLTSVIVWLAHFCDGCVHFSTLTIASRFRPTSLCCQILSYQTRDTQYHPWHVSKTRQKIYSMKWPQFIASPLGLDHFTQFC